MLIVNRDILRITTDDVLMVADNMGIHRDTITDDVIDQIIIAMSWGSNWGEIIENTLSDMLPSPERVNDINNP